MNSFNHGERNPDGFDYIRAGLVGYMLDCQERGVIPDLDVFFEVAAEIENDRRAALNAERPSQYFPHLNGLWR